MFYKHLFIVKIFINKYYLSATEMKQPPTKTISCQTQQFLPLIQIQDKLTSLYLRIKNDEQIKQQQADRIEYLQFKIDLMEQSLFAQQKLSKQKQQQLNKKLMKQLVELQERIVKENQEMHSLKQSFNTHINPYTFTFPSQTSQELPCFGDTQPCLNNITNLSNSITKQDLHAGFCTSRTADKDEMDSFSKICLKTQKYHNLGEKENEIDKKGCKNDRDDMKKRIMEVENKRLRKLNEQYQKKIKKLQKIMECRQKISIMSKLSSDTMDFEDQCSLQGL